MPSSSSMPSTMAHAVCRARVIGDTTTSLRTRIVRGCHAGAQAQAYTLNYVKGANFHIKLNGPTVITTSDCASKARPAGPVTARTRTLLGAPWRSN